MKPAFQGSPYAQPEDAPALSATVVEAEDCPSTAAPGVRTLPRVRARLLEALCREDFRTIQQVLPQYQQLLEQEANSGRMTPDCLARLESEHHRFHEQLKATLLTTRIRLRLDLERVAAARQYIEDGNDIGAIDLQG